MSTPELFSSPLYVRAFFLFGRWTCVACFYPPPPPPHLLRSKMVGPLVFRLKMLPAWDISLFCSLLQLGDPNTLNVTNLFTPNDKLNVVLF